MQWTAELRIPATLIRVGSNWQFRLLYPYYRSFVCHSAKVEKRGMVEIGFSCWAEDSKREFSEWEGSRQEARGEALEVIASERERVKRKRRKLRWELIERIVREVQYAEMVYQWTYGQSDEFGENDFTFKPSLWEYCLAMLCLLNSLSQKRNINLWIYEKQ